MQLSSFRQIAIQYFWPGQGAGPRAPSPRAPRHSCQDASASSSAPSFDEHSQADNGKRSAFDVS